MNKKLIFIIVGIIAVAAIAIFFMTRKKDTVSEAASAVKEDTVIPIGEALKDPIVKAADPVYQLISRTTISGFTEQITDSDFGETVGTYICKSGSSDKCMSHVINFLRSYNIKPTANNISINVNAILKYFALNNLN